MARDPGAIGKNYRSGHIRTFTAINFRCTCVAAIVTFESWRQFSGREVILGRNAKGIGDTIKECEHRSDIDCLSNLGLFPTDISELLHVLGRGFVSSFRDQLYILQKGAFAVAKASIVKLAAQDCFYALICGSLNPQEVSMTVQSIRTTIQVRDVAGNHLFVPPRQMAFREMDSI